MAAHQGEGEGGLGPSALRRSTRAVADLTAVRAAHRVARLEKAHVALAAADAAGARARAGDVAVTVAHDVAATRAVADDRAPGADLDLARPTARALGETAGAAAELAVGAIGAAEHACAGALLRAASGRRAVAGGVGARAVVPAALTGGRAAAAAGEEDEGEGGNPSVVHAHIGTTGGDRRKAVAFAWASQDLDTG